MNIKEIPFVNLIDIQQNDETLSLNLKEDILNHVGTIHAGAQFTLAETQSGVFLQNLFPELKGKVIPLLRSSNIKYKKPAQNTIIAKAIVDDELLKKFQFQFEKKGRSTIEVNVNIYDINEIVIAEASFTWFVMKIEEKSL